MGLLDMLQPYLTPAMTAVGSFAQGRQQAQDAQAKQQQNQILQMISMRRQAKQDADTESMNAARLADINSQMKSRDFAAQADKRAYDAGKSRNPKDPDYPDVYVPGDYVKLNATKLSSAATIDKENRQNEKDRYAVQLFYPELYDQWAPLENDPDNKPNWSKVLAIGSQRAGFGNQQARQEAGFGQQDKSREDTQTHQVGQQTRAFGQQDKGREDSQAHALLMQGNAQGFAQDQQKRAQDFAAAQKAAGGAGGVLTKVGMNRAWVRQVDRAILAVRANPGAFGFGKEMLRGQGGRLGRAWAQRADAGSNDVLSQVQDITSKLLHQRSGAAVTVSEYDRMRAFLPNLQEDSPEKIIMNLENMKRVAEEETSELEKLARPMPSDTRQSAPLRPMGGGIPKGKPGSAAANINKDVDDIIARARAGKK